VSADYFIQTFDADTIPVDMMKIYVNHGCQYSQAQVDAVSRMIEPSLEDQSYSVFEHFWVGETSTDFANPRHAPRSIAAIEALYERHQGIVKITPETIAAMTTAFSIKSNSEYEDNRNARGGRLRSKYTSAGVSKARELKKFLVPQTGQYSIRKID